MPCYNGKERGTTDEELRAYKKQEKRWKKKQKKAAQIRENENLYRVARNDLQICTHAACTAMKVLAENDLLDRLDNVSIIWYSLHLQRDRKRKALEEASNKPQEEK
jgi:hypothetical protein